MVPLGVLQTHSISHSRFSNELRTSEPILAYFQLYYSSFAVIKKFTHCNKASTTWFMTIGMFYCSREIDRNRLKIVISHRPYLLAENVVYQRVPENESYSSCNTRWKKFPTGPNAMSFDFSIGWCSCYGLFGRRNEILLEDATRFVWKCKAHLLSHCWFNVLETVEQNQWSKHVYRKRSTQTEIDNQSS